MPSTTNRPKAIDLFCGAGGMSLGFERAGFDIVLSVDFDPYHVATHKRNFPYGEAWVRSVADLDGKEILAQFGDIDVLFGGPPCQGFSHMGLRRADDSRNTLVSEFVRVVLEVRPKAVVMENVMGLGTGATKPVLDFVISSLEAAGYEITRPVRSLNALDFAVPQSRERLFLLAVLKGDIREPLNYPEPKQRRTTVWEALSDLPKLDPTSAETEDCLPYLEEPSSRYSRILRGLENDSQDYSRKRKWAKELCSGCTQVKHSPNAIALYSATPSGQMVPGHKLPRLAKAGYAPTLRAGSTSDHGSHTAPRPIHPESPRCITVREAARLHGFPDWFEFYPSKWHAYRQIGNAVCPPVAHAIGQQIVLALGLRPTADTTPCILGSTCRVEKSGRNEVRLKEVEQFPKVLEGLFEICLSRGSFNFKSSDIEQAIENSGAQLPRISPSNFIGALAKSRNVTKILSPLRSRGWTIRALPGGEGEFVTLGSKGTIEDRNQLALQSAELMTAVALPSIVSQREHLEMLELEQVLCNLSHTRWAKLRLIRDLFGATGDPALFEASTECGWKTGLVISSTGPALPRRKNVHATMLQKKVDLALVMAQLTQEHTLLIALENRDGQAIEIDRSIFVRSPVLELVGV